MMARDVVLLRLLVMKERETVMDPVMVVNMMDTPAARETWCAAATTASSLDTTSMRKMTAVSDLAAVEGNASQKGMMTVAQHLSYSPMVNLDILSVVVTMPMFHVCFPLCTMVCSVTSAPGLTRTTDTTRC